MATDPVLWPLHPERQQVAVMLRAKLLRAFPTDEPIDRGAKVAEACPECECWSLRVFDDGLGGRVVACLMTRCRDSPLNTVTDGHD